MNRNEHQQITEKRACRPYLSLRVDLEDDREEERGENDFDYECGPGSRGTHIVDRHVATVLLSYAMRRTSDAMVAPAN